MSVDTKTRCEWCLSGGEIYRDYHDTVWGVPQHEDRKLFEYLILEGAQAGLSWLTVLKKQESYRKAFADWDVEKVARFSEKKQAKLLENPGIIRNRLKVASAVRNAKAFLAVQDEFGSFDAYIWRFVDGQPVVNAFRSMQDIPASTALSDAMSKDLKARGFNFVGTTICYAHMQATGMVNDHTVDCFRYKALGGR